MQRACVHAGLWNISLSSLPPMKAYLRERQAERESEEPWDEEEEPGFPKSC